VITTIDEFKNYLSEMNARADFIAGQGWPEATNVESICAQMWVQFLPHAVKFWTVAGMLNQIADCLEPPVEDKEEDDEDE
jgi:hypothetical protein